jgi:amino acid transporter
MNNRFIFSVALVASVYALGYVISAVQDMPTRSQWLAMVILALLVITFYVLNLTGCGL